MNTPSNLTLLINNSIRLHDAQQEDAGFAEHTFDDLSGPAYEMLQATYDLHNNFTTMLRSIFTDGRSAEDIIEQLRDLMADRQEHLDRATTDTGPARAAELMATTAFITELGVIASSEAPAAVESAAPPAVVGETLRDRILHTASVHEASGESATLLHAIYLDEDQSDEAITVQLRALQIEIRERITRFLNAPDRAIRRAAAETLLAEIDVIIGHSTPAPDGDEDEYQEFTREEIIEDRAVNEAHRLLQAASPLQSTPWISRLVGDVARSSVAIACQSA